MHAGHAWGGIHEMLLGCRNLGHLKLLGMRGGDLLEGEEPSDQLFRSERLRRVGERIDEDEVHVIGHVGGHAAGLGQVPQADAAVHEGGGMWAGMGTWGETCKAACSLESAALFYRESGFRDFTIMKETFDLAPSRADEYAKKLNRNAVQWVDKIYKHRQCALHQPG